MNPDLWFKNFNMVIELDVAGEFIFNGIQEIYQTTFFRNDANTFVMLYNLSVGIERLQKIVVTLLEYNSEIGKENFEAYLKNMGHNHISLRDNIAKLAKEGKYKNTPKFSTRENEFFELLSRFYSDNRYMRFEVYQKTDGEVQLLNDYLEKHAKLDKNIVDDSIMVNDSVKRVLGKVISSIAQKYYSLVKEGSDRNGIFTYELRSYSKAEKVFIGESLYNEKYDESLALKELIIFIHNSKEKHPYLKFIEEIEPLEFDPAFIPDYINNLENGIVSQQLVDEVESLYEDVENAKDRRELVNLLDHSDVLFDYPYVEGCGKIIREIVENQSISDEQIKEFIEQKQYVIDYNLEELLDVAEKEMLAYQKKEISLSDVIEKIKAVLKEYKQYLIYQ